MITNTTMMRMHAVIDYIYTVACQFGDWHIYNHLITKIYIAELPKVEEKLERIGELLSNVSNLADLKDNGLRSFLPAFFNHLTSLSTPITDKKFSEQQFRIHMRDFLCSRDGRPYKDDLFFVDNQKINCSDQNTETPPLRIITVGYQHKR